MSDEAAKALAEAIARLAAAIERATIGFGTGVHIYHHDSSQQLSPGAPRYTTVGGYYGESGGR